MTTLFCFHHAGGSPAIFKRWSKLLPRQFAVHALELPRFVGATKSSDKPLVEVARRMAADIAQRGCEPFCLAGYSMGALIAFEVARALQRRGARSVGRLIVLGASAPQCSRTWLDVCSENDQHLIQFMRSSTGMTSDELASPEFASIVAAALRRDLSLLKSYRFEPGERLRCPILALGAEKDRVAPPVNLVGWRWHTQSRMRLRIVRGDHSFVRRGSDDELMQILTMVTKEAD